MSPIAGTQRARNSEPHVLSSFSGVRPLALWALALLAASAAGCGKGELPGQYFKVTLDGAENLCTGDGTGYHEEYEYRLIVDGTDLSVAIDEDVWALGTVDGCNLSYTSLSWSTYREDLEIQWEILGDAVVNLGGGGGCGDRDWEGTERYLITESAHPSVEAGCTYTLNVVGAFLREVGGETETTLPPPPAR